MTRAQGGGDKLSRHKKRAPYHVKPHDNPILTHSRDSVMGWVLYSDADIIAINKPAGLAVHVGKSGQESVSDYLPWLGKHPSKPPFLVHRLDQDTSGILLLARKKSVLVAMQQAISGPDVQKSYHALVHGPVKQKAGNIHYPLKKVSSLQEGWRMIVAKDGQNAHTGFECLEAKPDQSLLRLTLHTGRTHQIRVHLAQMGHPILGDPFYGKPDAESRLMLHASSVRLSGLPFMEKDVIEIDAPLPYAMANRL